MKRAFFLRLLLSLVLLVTQQMAAGHAMSHWTGAADMAAHSHADGKQKPAPSAVDEQGCAECLAYAQLASAIGSPAHALPGAAIGSVKLAAPSLSNDGARTVCVFQPRAPPLA